MSEFKGTKEKWKCIFTSDIKRAIRSEGGILMTFWKPTKYIGQDERYDQELKETQANQLLCLKAPEMLEMLEKFVKAVENEEIIIKENFDNDGFENCGNRLYNDFKQLIKQATEL